MSLTAICLLEWARRKFFMNSTYTMSRKLESKCFWAREAEMSLTAINSLESTRIKFFMNSTYIMSRKQESSVFGLGGRNESNSHQLARIGQNKIFHELDVHHVQKVGIKRFWAQEAQMSLRAISLLESARRLFFIYLTYIMSRKQE